MFFFSHNHRPFSLTPILSLFSPLSLISYHSSPSPVTLLLFSFSYSPSLFSYSPSLFFSPSPPLIPFHSPSPITLCRLLHSCPSTLLLHVSRSCHGFLRYTAGCRYGPSVCFVWSCPCTNTEALNLAARSAATANATTAPYKKNGTCADTQTGMCLWFRDNRAI